MIDPELGYNIVDLGFVYDVSVEEGVARITMTATSVAMPRGLLSQGGRRQQRASGFGIGSVDVSMTFDPPWQPGMISPEVKASFGFAAVN